MPHPRTEQRLMETNLPVLSNAVELVSDIVHSVAGNDVSNTLNGEPLTRTALSGVVAARFQGLLAPSMGDH